MLRKEFGGLRTGRASASLLDPVHVEAYGNNMPLNQVGTVSVPEPRLLIGPGLGPRRRQGRRRRRSARPALGLNPQTDGQTIRVPIPDLERGAAQGTDARRRQIRRAGARLGAQRPARRDRRAEEAGKGRHRSSQDQHRKLEKDIQALTDATIKRIDETAGAEGQGDPAGLTSMRAESIRRRLPPAHVAIIMDGNGRWAKSRGLPRVAGHRRGAEAVRRTVDGGRRARHLLPDAVRLLVGELEAPGRRGRTI